jgi:hypothetical protein
VKGIETFVLRAPGARTHWFGMRSRMRIFLAPSAMKRFFAEYENWMLDRPERQKEAPPAPRWRDRLKNEVESFAAALRSAGEFAPFRFDVPEKEGGGCSTSSVTI